MKVTPGFLRDNPASVLSFLDKFSIGLVSLG